MAVTRLKRKEKRNKIVAKKRVANIKALTKVPVIRKVDIEELKKLASSGTAGKAKDEAKK
jgi:hypothetical protein